MTQLDVIINIIKTQPKHIIDYTPLYDKYENYCGLKLTLGQKGGIRKNIQTHSSDCSSYNPKNQDLFYSVEGLGKGIWGLREKK